MTKFKIGIVGFGFVGKAVNYGFNNPKVEKIIVDPKGGHNIEELSKHDIKATFVCVPTPMGNDGSIDSSIIESVLEYLKNNVNGLIVIKSTVTPDIIQKLSVGIEDRFVYNPEFLTEKSANEDFVNPIMHIFGGEPNVTEKLENIYYKYSSCKSCPIYHMTASDASFVKYGINSFLATKVLWFNQFYDIIEKTGANYNVIVDAIGTDKRVGSSHTSVPGFDGKRGYGLSCFPKDTNAFLKFADGDFSIIKEVILRNNDYRTVYELDEREKLNNINFNLKVI